MNSLKLTFAFFILTNFLFPGLYGQRVSVEGVIIDSDSGEKVKNVNIFEEHSGTGTLSDGNGYFRLLLGSGEVRLFFNEGSYKEYVREFVLNGDTLLTVPMEIDGQQKHGLFKFSKHETGQTASAGQELLKNQRK